MLFGTHAQEQVSYLRSAVDAVDYYPSHCLGHSIPSRAYTSIDILLRHDSHFLSPHRVE
jgi:hypothetical protein